jgi:parkin
MNYVNEIIKLNSLIFLGMQPDEVKIIFAGKELDESTKFYVSYLTIPLNSLLIISIKFQECDLGQQSVLHAVKVTSRKTKLSDNLKKRLDDIYDEEDEVSPKHTSKPLSSTLIDLQLNDSDRKRIDQNHMESYKASFFVYCSDCKKICKGKLRVRCGVCKSGAIILARDPECWDDVLLAKRIHGICEENEIPCTSEDNGLPFVEFFFKCAEHSSSNNSAVPLNLIKTNLKNVHCLSCGDICNPVLIFPCKSGHCICLDCFKLYCESKIQDRSFTSDLNHGYSLSCPVNCENSLIKDLQHFKILKTEFYQRYQRFATEEFVIRNGGVLCPRPDCGMGIIIDDDCTKVHCRECGVS